MWLWPRPFIAVACHRRLGFDKSTCVQNLTILASAVSENGRDIIGDVKI